ncbi:MAG TPA: DUF2142 domain-containing protein [Chloroflexia bacterium]|nr:DUF2142 domain-containing protein [Chloroflexia bacterium]
MAYCGRPGVGLAILSFWLALIWVGAIRPLASPDEISHLEVVMQVRKQHILPEIHYDFSKNPAGEVVGTPADPETRAYAQSLGFGDPYRLEAHEATQPPLYYLVAGIAAYLVPPTPILVLYVSRIVAALFGALMIYFFWAAARELVPRSPLWAIGATGVVILLPQFCFNRAGASNDSAINMVATASFYVWFRGLRDPRYDPWLVRAGALLGLGVLTKFSALTLVPGLGLVFLFHVFQGAPGRGAWRAKLQRALRMAAGGTGAALAICGWWLVRNALLYGDPTNLQSLMRFNTGKLAVLDFHDPRVVDNFVQSTWQSFWGVFGWLDILMPPEFYAQVLVISQVLTGFAGIALVIRLVRHLVGRPRITSFAWQAAAILGVTTGTVLYSDVQFSMTVAFQAQGRYLFFLLLPGALVFTGGLYGLVPGRPLKIVALSLPLLWLAAMNAVALGLIH